MGVTSSKASLISFTKEECLNHGRGIFEDDDLDMLFGNSQTASESQVDVSIILRLLQHKTDVHLSHILSKERDPYLDSVNEILQDRGVRTSITAPIYEANKLEQSLITSIRRAKFVVIFITREYLSNIASKKNICFLEFSAAMKWKADGRVIAVVREADLVKDSSLWPSEASVALDKHICLDFSSEDLSVEDAAGVIIEECERGMGNDVDFIDEELNKHWDYWQDLIEDKLLKEEDKQEEAKIDMERKGKYQSENDDSHLSDTEMMRVDRFLAEYLLLSTSQAEGLSEALVERGINNVNLLLACVREEQTSEEFEGLFDDVFDSAQLSTLRNVKSFAQSLSKSKSISSTTLFKKEKEEGRRQLLKQSTNRLAREFLSLHYQPKQLLEMGFKLQDIFPCLSRDAQISICIELKYPILKLIDMGVGISEICPRIYTLSDLLRNNVPIDVLLKEGFKLGDIIIDLLTSGVPLPDLLGWKFTWDMIIEGLFARKISLSECLAWKIPLLRLKEIFPLDSFLDEGISLRVLYRKGVFSSEELFKKGISWKLLKEIGVHGDELLSLGCPIRKAFRVSDLREKYTPRQLKDEIGFSLSELYDRGQGLAVPDLRLLGYSAADIKACGIFLPEELALQCKINFQAIKKSKTKAPAVHITSITAGFVSKGIEKNTKLVRELFVGRGDGLISVYSLSPLSSSTKSLASLYGHSGSVLCLLLLNDHKSDEEGEGSKLLASGGGDHTIKIFDLNSNAILMSMLGHSYSVKCLHYVGENQLVSGGVDQTVRLWHWERTKSLSKNRRSEYGIELQWEVFCEQIFRGHEGTVCSLYSRSELLLSGAEDRTIRLWNRRDGRCLKVLEGHRGEVTGLSLFIKNSNPFLVSCADDGMLKVWDLSSGGRCLLSEKTTLKDGIAKMYLLQERYLICGGGDGGMCIYDIIHQEYDVTRGRSLEREDIDMPVKEGTKFTCVRKIFEHRLGCSIIGLASVGIHGQDVLKNIQSGGDGNNLMSVRTEKSDELTEICQIQIISAAADNQIVIFD